MAKGNIEKSMLAIHLVGASLCVLIGFGSVWFAADSIARRRGLFLSARHELASVRTELEETASRRAALSSQVRALERATSDTLRLEPARRLNIRSAEITELAEASGISVDALQPMEMIHEARVRVRPLDFRGSAGADDVASFLDALGERMPDIHVHRVELNSESLGSDRVRVQLTLYWFVDPAGET